MVVTLASGALLALFLFSVPPVDESGNPDLPVIVAAIGLAVVAAGGVGAILALLAHGRWPALAGAHHGPADPAVALRQGVIVAATAGVLLVLTLLDILDVAFLIVTLIVAGLIEAFLQSRS